MRIITPTLIIVAIFYSLLFYSNQTSAAVIQLKFINGELIGADNLVVNNRLYNVRFIDGSCVSLFEGCDEASDFIFKTRVEAAEAARVLIEKVFIDSPNLLLDTRPQLTRGCESDGIVPQCIVSTVIFENSAITTLTINGSNNSSDWAQGYFAGAETIFDTTKENNLVYAKWQAVSVSAPTSLTLFLLVIFMILVSSSTKYLKPKTLLLRKAPSLPGNS